MLTNQRRYFKDNEGKRVLTFTETLAFGATDTEKTFTIETSCLLHFIHLVLPNWTNPVTASLSIDRLLPDMTTGRQLFLESGITENQGINILPKVDDVSWPIPLDGIVKVTVTLSGAPGGSGGSVEANLFGV